MAAKPGLFKLHAAVLCANGGCVAWWYCWGLVRGGAFRGSQSLGVCPEGYILP